LREIRGRNDSGDKRLQMSMRGLAALRGRKVIRCWAVWISNQHKSVAVWRQGGMRERREGDDEHEGLAVRRSSPNPSAALCEALSQTVRFHPPSSLRSVAPQVWDYHVVCAARLAAEEPHGEETTVILDLDSTLPFPCRCTSRAAPSLSGLPARLHSLRLPGTRHVQRGGLRCGSVQARQADPRSPAPNIPRGAPRPPRPTLAFAVSPIRSVGPP